MASIYNDGISNAAYHDSETLELDRGPSFRKHSSFHHNPYGDHEDDEDEDHVGYPGRAQERPRAQRFLPMNSVQPEFDYNQQLPRYSNPISDDYGGHINPAFQHESEPYYPDQTFQGRFPYMDTASDISEADTNVRRRSKRQSSVPMQILTPSLIARPETSLGNQTASNYMQENEKLVGKLSEMSEADISKEIQKLPKSLNEKRGLRNNVIKMKQKSFKSSQNCCAGCTYSIKKSFRRLKQFVSDVSTAFKLWHSTLKVIEGKFGTSILSYFIFLRWLLAFNIFSFVVNFSFITIPQFFDMSPNNLTFSGLELLTGAGYFEDTVLYYGYYTNQTIRKHENLAPYNMQLAYIFTIGLYLATCFFILLYSMAKSFRDNFINPASFSGNAAKLLCSWDFSITNEKAVKLKRRHLSTQIKETVSEKLMGKLELTLKEKMRRIGIHVAAWFLSTGITAGCCAGVYYLCIKLDSLQSKNVGDLTKQAATLLVPVIVALINVVVPLIYAVFDLVEKFKYPRHHIYTVIIRNVFLKISIIGILCYYWLESVAMSNRKCWESYVGQDIYRLVVIDFIFALIGSFFGEFVRRIIGTRCCKKLGTPEFDIARNVLDLIYAQTLAWIGIFFSPLLPIIQILKLFIIFYVKRVSLMMNCIPPRRAWRASQMTTVFIFLLFFPSFAGALCVIGVTVWRRQPSKTCGPFQTLDEPYNAISNWVADITVFENSKWVVWIYHNLVESVLFFYILTLIVLIISYLYWQIVRGRKTMVKLLLEQIGNEGKDKTFLLQELRRTHNSYEAPVIVPYQRSPKQLSPSLVNQESHSVHGSKAPFSRSESIGGTNALELTMMAKHQADLEETSLENRTAGEGYHQGSDAIALIMRARQQAELLRDQSMDRTPPSDAMAMIMRARQQAELEREQSRSQIDTSEALAMAMRARQQAEMDR
ncbi:transmembrane channel-like protein 5 isoform X2 [Spea bombifrons]|uniref:transmembrane channel-like protein 5 isoform X2 n=1 Tax=Spea bombifrons TaxID=233779 RepID=UPI00234BD632|nr:transmembrane channel-like protein 5 isoform X2 [Spea bombifrons]